jgi:glyoxylase-like metal-dependent hydrolase (beta-lactamase superfamily II)
MLALALLLLTLTATPAGAAGAGFTADAVAEGVYLMRAAAGRQDLSNSLVVEQQDGLLIVDAQPTPAAARELLEAVGKISSKPVRYLVYSKPQAEAVGGASAFPESVLTIASDGCAAALEDPAYDFSLQLRLRVGNPEGWEPPARRSPTLVIAAQTTLVDAVNSVRLFPIGHAQTEGDMLVLLPDEKIVYAGSLLTLDRNPFAADANVGGWLNALNRIATLAPNLVLPARGAAVEARIVRERRDSLAWLRGQVEKSFADKVNPARMPEQILSLPDAATYFDLEAEPSFAAGLVERAIAEAIGQRRKRGLWQE